ncbi:unannotated protein [freshwater metagenome]|uniref:Unannotated protein n=1 Tax=freshwater metagenome TaxID=449393 RepID=A0A6J7H2K9_9ZZZZ
MALGVVGLGLGIIGPPPVLVESVRIESVLVESVLAEYVLSESVVAGLVAASSGVCSCGPHLSKYLQYPGLWHVRCLVG